MKVVIGIPCLLRGGTEVQTLMLSKALLETKNVVYLICYHEYMGDVVREFESSGVKVLLLKWKRNISPIRFILNLKTLLQRINPDVVHVQYLSPGFLPIISAKLAGISKIIATIHQPGTPYTLKNKILVRLGALLCNRFITVSLFVEKSWFKTSSFYNGTPAASQKKSHGTIYNSVDVSSIENILNKQEAETILDLAGISSNYILGIISRLSYEKGIDLFLHAFSKVIESFPSVSVLIVGDGSERESLERQARDLKISDNVIFLGSKSREDVIRLIAVMDLIIIPSRFEGFGLSAIEALSCGKPILAARTGGLNEIIDRCPNNYSFIPENVEDLAKVLRLILNKPKSELKSPIYLESVKKNFDFPIYLHNISALYNSLNWK